MAAAAIVASAVLSAASSIKQGQLAKSQAEAQEKAALYEQQAAERDKLIADQNRQLALQNGEIAADDQRRENRRTLSAIRAAYGASGLTQEGAPLEVLQDSAFEGELDAQRASYEGKVKARESAVQMLGLQDRAALAGIEASAARSRAKSAMTIAYLNAGASLAGGAGNLGMYNRMGTTGTQPSKAS